MSGARPFDDGRFPDQEGLADCFLCGRPVDPLDSNRGFYEEAPAGALLPIHLPCIDAIRLRPGFTRRVDVLSFEYLKALNVMADRQLKIAQQ